MTIDEYFNMVDLTAQISKDFGISFRYVDMEEFSREMKRLATVEDPIFPMVDFIARTHSKVVIMERKRYRNTAFRLALEQSGAGVPDAPLPEVVSFMMAHLGARGMLPAG